MINIKIPIRSEKKAVIEFIKELKEILESDSFSSEKDIIIIKKEKEDIEFSTRYTLLDLGYDSFDVASKLRELTVSHYSETLMDRQDSNPTLLFVFGEIINDKQVYIKLRFKEVTSKKILCLSFHYAQHKMEFPYKK